jgi:glucokinase
MEMLMDCIGAVDVGGTKIAVGLVLPDGTITASHSQPTRPEQSFEAGMAEIAANMQSMLEKTHSRLLGVGLGCTGQVSPGSGKVLSNAFLPNWAGNNPVDWLATRFGVPGALENDADAAALAEWRLGAGQGAQRFIYITVSTGIGGGLIFDGQVERGANECHPEVGHHTIDPNGPDCFCGNRGCWETLASGRALAARFMQICPGFQGDAVTVCDLAEAGDPLACRAVEAHAQALGIGLANLITLYVPDVIALGGGLMRRAGLFMPGIQRMVEQRCRLVRSADTRLVLSHFGAETGLVGAAMVWAQHNSSRPR